MPGRRLLAAVGRLGLALALAASLATAVPAGAQSPPADEVSETPPVDGTPPRAVVRPPSEEAIAPDLETGLEDATAPPAGAELREEAAAEAVDATAGWSSFSITLEDGSTTRGKAPTFEYEPDQYLIAPEGIELLHRDVKVNADRARLDIPTNVLTAEGNVVIDEGPRRMTGDTLEYDLDTRTGRLSNATAFVDPDYYFEGAEIAKIGDDTYSITDGVFTSCSEEVPDWSIALSSATVTLEEYARIKHARLKVKRAPVIYWPYMLWPAKTERSSGFLMPQPSYSRRRGAYLGLAYFQTMGRSADATFYTDLYSKEFYGVGTEVRYRPSESTEGILRGYVLSEPDDLVLEPDRRSFDPSYTPGDTRWKLQYFHKYEKSLGFWGQARAVIDLQEYSDFDFLSDYERNVTRQTQPVIHSKGFFSLNKGRQSFNLLVDQRERLVPDGPVTTFRQLPEIEYDVRSLRLGETPLYFSLDSSAHYLSIERQVGTGEAQTSLEESYGRVDIFPTLTAPLSSLPWLSASLDLSSRVTHYTDSRPPGGGELVGESLTRDYSEAALEVVGPRFSRIFDVELGKFDKLKHLIEPRIDYLYRDEFEDADAVPSFDEIDRFLPGNGATFSLTNRFLAKPSDPEEGGAFEIASFELSQFYSFDDERPGQGRAVDELSRAEGPLRAQLRINPSQGTSIKAEANYSTLFGHLNSLSLSGGLKVGRNAFGLTWFPQWDAESGETTRDQLRLFTSLWLVPDRMRVDSEASYNLRDSELVQQRHFITWQAQCWGVQLELRESTIRDITDRDFRFAVTLKNVGTFLDLTGGVDSF